MHLVQFTENVIKGCIHCLRSAELYVIHCLRKMGIYSKACFKLTDIVLLIYKILMGYNNRILFAIHSDGYWVTAG